MKTASSRSILVAITLATLTICNASSALAQMGMPGPTDGITVSGNGEASAKPDVLEINFRVSGTAELVSDALTKYANSQKTAIAAFKALKIPNLKIEEKSTALSTGGNSYQAYRMMQMGQTPSNKAQLTIGGLLLLRMEDIDKTPQEEVFRMVAKLCDTAKDAGLSPGPTQAELAMAYESGNQGRNNGTLVQFVVSDLVKLREIALGKAVEDARSRAERLAKLYHMDLGPAISISEGEVAPNEGEENSGVPVRYARRSGKAARLLSESPSDMVYRTRVMVRYALVPAKADKSAAVTNPGATDKKALTINGGLLLNRDKDTADRAR